MAAWRAPRGWSRLGLRARLTLIATVALAVFLAAGSVLLLYGFSTSRLHAIDSTSRSAASDIASLTATGALPPTLPVQAGQSAQVLTARGQVLAVSPGTSRTLPLVPAGALARLARTGPSSGNVSQTAATGVNRILVRPVRVRGATYYVVVVESLRDERATLSSLGRYLAIAAPVLLVLVGATLWMLLGRALTTVSGLRRGAEAVTDPAGGVRLPLPGSQDEIRALAVTLNAMLDRLAAAAGRERQFVADVAHELRSPLAALHTQLEVALRQSDPARQDELVAGALEDAGRLAALIDDLLTLARMEAEQLPVSEPVDVAELAGLVRADPYVVLGDRPALARAVDNLVANANRHAAGQVVVDVVRTGSTTIEVRVDDDGPGVPVRDRQRVFERFVRLDDARARDDGGTGLGLAIVRATAHTHRGSVRVEDSPLGGARFVLVLPAAPDSAVPELDRRPATASTE
ncbi:MAG TPA: HAMP domain-containing sensor histidine kinase [Mycobacteriales bacterium]|nr:HAMP domain-containing sensor histidine kinase [Mycobacteriales bacterium]